MYNAEHNLRAIKCENLSQSRARQIDLESMIRKKKVVSRVTVDKFPFKLAYFTTPQPVSSYEKKRNNAF